MRTTQFHGIISIGLILIAIIIALVVMFLTWWVLGAVYLIICVAAPQAILRAYCAKCPCKAHCGHVFPGKAAMKFNRKPGPYTSTELAVLGLSALLLFGFPQFWLWQYPGLFVAFWVLSSIASIQIRTFVCKICDNIYCPLKARHLR